MTDLKELKRKARRGDVEAYCELLDEYERRRKEKEDANEEKRE